MSVIALALCAPFYAASQVEKVLTLPVPKDDQAALVFARSGSFNAKAATAFVFVDDEFVGVLKNNTWSPVFVPPGEHVVDLAFGLSNKGGDVGREVIVRAEAGRTYGVQCKFRVNWAPELVGSGELAGLVGETDGISHAKDEQAAVGGTWAGVLRVLRPVMWHPIILVASATLMTQVRESAQAPQDGWREWIVGRIHEGIPVKVGNKEVPSFFARRRSLGEKQLLALGLYEAAAKSDDRALWIASADLLDQTAQGLARLKSIADGSATDTSDDPNLRGVIQNEAMVFAGFSGDTALELMDELFLQHERKDASTFVEGEKGKCLSLATAARSAEARYAPDADKATAKACAQRALQGASSSLPTGELD